MIKLRRTVWVATENYDCPDDDRSQIEFTTEEAARAYVEHMDVICGDPGDWSYTKCEYFDRIFESTGEAKLADEQEWEKIPVREIVVV